MKITYRCKARLIYDVWTGERSGIVEGISIRLLGIGFSFVYNEKVCKWHSCECMWVLKNRVRGPVMYGYDPAVLSSASISNPNVNDQNAQYF